MAFAPVPCRGQGGSAGIGPGRPPRAPALCLAPQPCWAGRAMYPSFRASRLPLGAVSARAVDGDASRASAAESGRTATRGKQHAKRRRVVITKNSETSSQTQPDVPQSSQTHDRGAAPRTQEATSEQFSQSAAGGEDSGTRRREGGGTLAFGGRRRRTPSKSTLSGSAAGEGNPGPLPDDADKRAYSRAVEYLRDGGNGIPKQSGVGRVAELTPENWSTEGGPDDRSTADGLQDKANLLNCETLNPSVLENGRRSSRRPRLRRRGRKVARRGVSLTAVPDNCAREQSSTGAPQHQRVSRTANDNGAPQFGERDSIQRDLMYGNESQTRKALARLASGRVKISIAAFDRLLSSLSRSRRLRTALALIKISEASPFAQYILPRRTVKTLTIMIDVYGKSRQLEVAFNIFTAMKKAGFAPNVITYNALISSCSRNNEPELAHKVFDEMQRAGLDPDKFTYASLIDVHAKRGDVERAFEVSRLMSESGVQKDQTIYSALMEACSKVKQLDRALLVFQDMVRQGLWPNLISFAVLLDCCANVREPYKAFELFAEMRYWELEPNVVTWTALLDACSKAGWPERAELVLQHMRNAGVEPNEITYGALVDAWARQGCLHRAFDAVDRMAAVDGVAPNAVLIGALVDACRRLQDGTHIAKVWELVQKHNVRPARGYYPALVSLASLARDIDTALAILAHCHARGMLRRVSFGRKDPTLEALAYSFVCLMKACEEHEESKKQLTRLDPLLKATSLGDLSGFSHISLEEAFMKVSRAWECEETHAGSFR